MIICTKKKKLADLLFKKNASVGFVPTMGALHEGHLSLIEKSKQDNAITVCSIFVNPTQFNDKADFEKYPRTTEQDILLLNKADCDILFLPDAEEMYPAHEPVKVYKLNYLEQVLEGKYRPGHFQGVCRIVDELLQIVQPDKLYLGQKDYQQCMVIKKLIQDHFSGSIELVICTTLREPSGLAMSSRNMRLSKGARQKAVAIFNSLQQIQNHIQHTAFASLEETIVKSLLQSGFEKIDYVVIANAENLKEELHFNPQKKYVALIAAFINGVRLIDNLLLNTEV